MTTKRLFEKYREAAIRHHVRLIEGNVRASNRAADRLFGFWKEIKAGGPEMLEQLKLFLQDEDPSVRGWAAAQLLEDMPQDAEPVLERLAIDAPWPITSNAEWSLAEWRDKLAHGGESTSTKIERLLEEYRQAVFCHQAAIAACVELTERAKAFRHADDPKLKSNFLTLRADKSPAVGCWAAMHTMDYGPMGDKTLRRLASRAQGWVKIAVHLVLAQWQAGRLTFPGGRTEALP
jgi:hypothetical protein